jgi:hypothetical protein
MRVLDRGSRLGTIVNGSKLAAGSECAFAPLDRPSNALTLGLSNSPYRFLLEIVPKR